MLKTRLQDGWVESEVKTVTVAKKPRKKRVVE
jgi:exodeoxyribonuclease VII large subunit